MSHLGYRSPAIGRLLPAGGYPGNEPARSVPEFLLRNIPLALVFVLPHSLLVPHRCACQPHQPKPMLLTLVLHNCVVRSSVVVTRESLTVLYFGNSIFASSRLYRVVGPYGRLSYNVISAATLHALLVLFVPLTSPVVMVLPIPGTIHVALSAGCLVYAMVAFATTPSTW